MSAAQIGLLGGSKDPDYVLARPQSTDPTGGPLGYLLAAAGPQRGRCLALPQGTLRAQLSGLRSRRRAGPGGLRRQSVLRLPEVYPGERQLKGYDLVALFLDGKTFAEDEMVIAAGVTLTKEKVKGPLCVLDGAKRFRTAPPDRLRRVRDRPALSGA